MSQADGELHGFGFFIYPAFIGRRIYGYGSLADVIKSFPEKKHSAHKTEMRRCQSKTRVVVR